MKTILTDLGTEYKNEILNELCKLLKIEKRASTAYHHQTIGTVERAHRTLNEYLRSYITLDRSDWDTWLSYFVYCYNTTPSTVHDYCPFELIFGKNPNTFDFTNGNLIDPLYNVDAYQKEIKYRLQTATNRANRIITNTKIKQKTSYDKNINHKEFKIGDLVLIEKNAGHKLEAVYKGPYKISNFDKFNNAIVLDKNNRNYSVHKNRLKPYNNTVQQKK